jgi:hypothetical protein
LLRIGAGFTPIEDGLDTAGTVERSGEGNVSYRETFAWILFCATSVHLAFLQPYIVIIPGERGKVLSGLFCAISLIAATAFAGRRSSRIKAVPVAISGALVVLVILSGLFSQTPALSSVRGFAAVTAALGGFWCARLLLYSPVRQKYYLWLSVGMLSGIFVLAFVGNVTTGLIFPLLDSHWHPVANRIILFSFAPLALLYMKPVGMKAVAIVLLSLSYVILLLGGKTSGMESAVFIPVGMLLLAVFVWELRSTNKLRLSIALMVLLAMSMTLGNHISHRPSQVAKGHQSVAYRVENVFLSWKIAKENPFLGNGLLAPRQEYLADYEPQYPYIAKTSLDKWTDMLRTSENIFFTCLADLGFPFVILYSCVLFVLLCMLLRAVFHPPPEYVFHPLALLLPVAGALLHYQVVDGLIHPQLSWFFHVLLGLIPTSRPTRDNSGQTGWSILVRAALIVGAFIGGLALGGLLPAGFPLEHLGFHPSHRGY